MNWAEMMKEHADLASRDLVAIGATVMQRHASASWEPHEGWLSPLRPPSDLAALEPAQNVFSAAERSPG